jgi:dynein heavy chain
MENNQGGKVPFDDLIYIFGEIMYGGHIVDDWDRRLTINYLYNIMNDKLFDEIELFPFIEGKGLSFKVPGPNVYEKYLEHIDVCLQTETPLAYGLHSNTEIGFRTTQCVDMFAQLYELQPKDNEAAGAADIKTNVEMYLFIVNFKSCRCT